MKKIKVTTDDRPGSTDKIYENVETGQLAKIIKYEDKYKTLILMFDDSKGISITYSTFNKQWREKC